MFPFVNLRVLCGESRTIILVLLLAQATSAHAKMHPSRGDAAGTHDYVAALATANRFLSAWQARDHETGLVLLTDSAKKHSSQEQVESFFSSPSQGSFEITRGKKLKGGRYTFPVALYEQTGHSPGHCRPRYSLITVVKTGKDDWAVDTLP